MASTLLGVRGGILVTPQLLYWFHDTVGQAPVGKAYRHDGDRVPVCFAFATYTLYQHAPQSWTCELLAAQVAAPIVIVPAAIACHTIQELARPGGDRELLSTVGKPTDRWHVEWVRRWTFPGLRWLARAHIQPNHVTWSGFGVVLVACWCLAQGSYWSGILGATLLYASWVLDCMDGTLARLTCTESARGQQLDTVLGHLSNLCIFGALIWAVYGAEPIWKGATVAVFLLGGIEVAQRLSVAEKTRRGHRHTTHLNRLRTFLDKINHRDYAVWIFFLAIVNGLPLFLWFSLVGVQIYWLLQLWLLAGRYRQRFT
jgi:phosphatidylglycerophosphate synthase